MTDRFRVGIIYGGASGEHEISLISAYWVLHYLDKSKYEPVAIGIDKSGQFWLNTLEQVVDAEQKILRVKTDGAIALASLTGHEGLNLDIIFPAIHGPLYEDGHLQGMLTLCDLPFVGPEMTTCAVAMDKILSKQIAQMNGIPVVPWQTIHRAEYDALGQEALVERILAQLELPLVVKPANLGSSVGISFVKDQKGLEQAIVFALQYDKKILIEKAVSGHELEIAVLENKTDPLQPRVTLAGEIIVSEDHEFYSYDAKYTDPNGAHEVIPAEISQSLHEQCQRYAQAAFVAFGGTGMARIDFLYHQADDTLYFNEFNPIPGFTPISFFPKLWQQQGLGFTALLSELLEIALLNAERRKQLSRDYSG